MHENHFLMCAGKLQILRSGCQTSSFDSGCLATFVPNFAIIVTLIGCTVESLAGYIFPFALQLKLKYGRHGKIKNNYMAYKAVPG